MWQARALGSAAMFAGSLIATGLPPSDGVTIAKGLGAKPTDFCCFCLGGGATGEVGGLSCARGEPTASPCEAAREAESSCLEATAREGTLPLFDATKGCLQLLALLLALLCWEGRASLLAAARWLPEDGCVLTGGSQVELEAC